MLAEQRALTFGMLFEDGEVKVIGDEPANTDYDPGLSEKALIARRRLAARCRRPTSALPSTPCALW